MLSAKVTTALDAIEGHDRKSLCHRGCWAGIAKSDRYCLDMYSTQPFVRAYFGTSLNWKWDDVWSKGVPAIQFI